MVKDSETFNDAGIFEAPIKAPDGAIVKTEESALELLERVTVFNENWIELGHNSGDNRNNVSATINIKDDEWDEVRNWMWSNRNSFNGLSIFPHFGGTHKELPFEEIDKKTYNKMIKTFVNVDLTKITETEDNTTQTDEIACGPSGCEII